MQKKDKFSRAVELYQQKYKMQVDSLVKFIRQKVDSSPTEHQTIQNYILALQSITDAITPEQLRQYFHLVAAVQSKAEVAGKTGADLQGYSNIKFKTKKSKTDSKAEEQVEAKELKVEAGKKSSKVTNKEQASSIQLYPKFDQKSPLESKPLKSERPQGKPPSPQIAREASKLPMAQVPLNYFTSQRQLGVIQQNAIQQDRGTYSGKVSKSQEFFVRFPEAEVMKIRGATQKPVQITGYDKFGQNYLNPIIKYRIVYKDKTVYRRYTEFEYLMRTISKQYEGFILPQLPPKEGIKSNLSYFRGLDEAFLNERQIKLEEYLNTLLTSRFVCEDETLNRFLTEEDEFQITDSENGGTMSYLRSLGEIAFNAKQLKSYGLAYYNYLKSFKKQDINTKVTEHYRSAQPLLSYLLALEHYRTAITSNFDRRREIFQELQVDQCDRTLTIADLDRLSAASAAEVRNLEKEMNRYYQLKSEESWLGYLLGQKEIEGGQSLEEIRNKQKEVQIRIQRMERNLVESIDSLIADKTHFIEQISTLVIDWRRRIHP